MKYQWSSEQDPQKKQNMSKSICYFSYRCVSYTIFVIIFFLSFTFFFSRIFGFRPNNFFSIKWTAEEAKKKNKNWNKNIIRHSLYIFFCFRFSAIQTIFRMAEEYQKNTENKEARDWFMALCEYIEVYIFLGIYYYIYIYLRLKRCNYFLYFIIYIKYY